jgi:hypothetical protein
MEVRHMNQFIRPIRFEGNIAYVPLTKGYEAVIDAEDAVILQFFSWSAKPKPSKVYAVTGLKSRSGYTTVLMHRMIMRYPLGLQVDHIDGDGLNNRKSNLRVATHAQNMWNRGPQHNNTSGFRGVSWHEKSAKWQARIKHENGRMFLGYFDTAEAANEAYIEASKRLHGDFAYHLNACTESRHQITNCN